MKDSQIYLTQDSIQKKLKIQFGHKCDFLSNRFFKFLADNIDAKRIYFKEFYDKLQATIFSEETRDNMKFAFALLDFDYNGQLNGVDLLKT